MRSKELAEGSVERFSEPNVVGMAFQRQKAFGLVGSGEELLSLAERDYLVSRSMRKKKGLPATADLGEVVEAIRHQEAARKPG